MNKNTKRNKSIVRMVLLLLMSIILIGSNFEVRAAENSMEEVENEEQAASTEEAEYTEIKNKDFEVIWRWQSGDHIYVNEDGEEVLCVDYYYAFDFHEGRALVMLDGSWGYIDVNGEEVIPLQYDNAFSFHEGFAAVEKDGFWGYIDENGEEVIPLQYEWVFAFHEGRAEVKKNGSWGYIDVNGEEVIPLQYDNEDDFHEWYASARKNDFERHIDKADRQHAKKAKNNKKTLD